jgi:transcriptional regulator GlxA family with amidase domain
MQNDSGTGSSPAIVARLDEALPGWWQAPVRVAQLARAAGVSTRTVHRAFRRQLGASPIARIRDERLELARRQLLEAVPGTTVTSVAFDWGFQHLGRFAAQYRSCFGERPSDTLRRVRAVRGGRLARGSDRTDSYRRAVGGASAAS